MELLALCLDSHNTKKSSYSGLLVCLVTKVEVMQKTLMPLTWTFHAMASAPIKWEPGTCNLFLLHARYTLQHIQLPGTEI